MTKPRGKPPTRRSASPELLEFVAQRFRALGEPARLSVLHALEGGERSVSDLVATTGMSQGNLSKHLQLLHAMGFLKRRREGAWVFYALADDSVLTLCELMCDRLEDDVDAIHALVRAR
ncbi:MAG: helix-turn-helix transcriptional regulator [Gemmatimonadetes bacterium]|nr:helix-turn-helix transcriptional regulator [Gemmatimonadota bacterium]MBI3567858.1 helix-turn-helix transcriptional regulator [Gemmatimonadota bacterium]